MFLRTPLCAEKQYGDEERPFLENAVHIQIFLAARPTAMVGTQRGAPGGAHFLKCLPLT